MRRKNQTIWMMVVALCLSSPQVMGVMEFKDGGTHDINYEIADDVRVDWRAPGMQTTVNLLDGAYLPLFQNCLTAFEDSRINMLGGHIGLNLYAYDRSQVTMSGGTISGDLYAYQSSQVMISSGSIHDNLHADDSSQITMSGGRIFELLHACDRSHVTISGGNILTLEAWDSSHVTISSGSIVDLYSFRNSQVTISGGDTFSLDAFDSSQVRISGGSMELLYAGESCQVTISGGSIDLLDADDTGQVTIQGSDFAVNGNYFGYGELTSILGGDHIYEPPRHLTGILANGNILDNDFLIGGHARIVLVPEPATVLLIGLGALAILRKRRL